MTIAASLLCAALLLAACGDDDDGARVVSGPRIVELDGGDSTAVVERDPFRIAFGGAALVAADDPAGGVFYERNGLRHRLLRVVADRADGDGVALDVETSEGEMAHVQLRLDSPRTLAITVDPPRAESIASLDARMESPAGEEIGGFGAHAPWDMPTEPRFDVELVEILPPLHDAARHLAAVPRGTSSPSRRNRNADGATDGVRIPRRRHRPRPVGPIHARPRPLVTPLWRSGDRSRDVYLPAGTWTNCWNESEIIEGPTTIEVDAPLDVIPVYRRQSS